MSTAVRSISRVDLTELATLFFCHAAAIGSWFVPMGGILDHAGLSAIKPLAFASSGVACFISPLLFGALADRRFAPVLVLRWLAAATAGAVGLAACAIKTGAPPWLVLLAIQVQTLFSSPTWGLTSSIVFSRLANSKPNSVRSDRWDRWDGWPDAGSSARWVPIPPLNLGSFPFSSGEPSLHSPFGCQKSLRLRMQPL